MIEVRPPGVSPTTSHEREPEITTADPIGQDHLNSRIQQSFVEVFSDALRGVPCVVHGLAPDRSGKMLPMRDWRSPASPLDQLLLDHCRDTTVDIGSGPGRMSAYLARRGHCVLGVDIVREAVYQTRRRGVAALRRDIFDPMPGEGEWDTALLADGNIGIGGAPVLLLRRCAQLLRKGGRVVCDLAEPGTGVRVHDAHIATSEKVSTTFPWAEVGPDAIYTLAASSGLKVQHVGERAQHWFAVLTT